MPRPLNERQSLERELREELPAQLAAYRQLMTGAFSSESNAHIQRPGGRPHTGGRA